MVAEQMALAGFRQPMREIAATSAMPPPPIRRFLISLHAPSTRQPCCRRFRLFRFHASE
jgi:hypothetical protein